MVSPQHPCMNGAEYSTSNHQLISNSTGIQLNSPACGKSFSNGIPTCSFKIADVHDKQSLSKVYRCYGHKSILPKPYRLTFTDWREVVLILQGVWLVLSTNITAAALYSCTMAWPSIYVLVSLTPVNLPEQSCHKSHIAKKYFRLRESFVTTLARASCDQQEVPSWKGAQRWLVIYTLSTWSWVQGGQSIAIPHSCSLPPSPCNSGRCKSLLQAHFWNIACMPTRKTGDTCSDEWIGHMNVSTLRATTCGTCNVFPAKIINAWVELVVTLTQAL